MDSECLDILFLIFSLTISYRYSRVVGYVRGIFVKSQYSHFSSLLAIVILVSTIISGGYAADSPENNMTHTTLNDTVQVNMTSHSSPDTWTRKISSDLLQLLDPASCSPGRTPADISRDMKVLNQLRYDSEQRAEVLVIITLNENANGDRIYPYLNQTVSDPSYGMISGWVHVDAIPAIGNMYEVRQIATQLPPALSGSVSINSPGNLNPDLIPNMSTKTPAYSLPSGSLNITPDSNSVNHSVGSGRRDPEPEDIHWKEKLSTDLLQLLDSRYLSPGQSSGEAQALMSATGELRTGAGNSSEVMISARISPGSPAVPYMPYFSRAESDPLYGQISGWMSIANLSRLAGEPGIISVMAQIPPVTSGVVTEGDDLLYARDFRNITNLTGKGVKIGIISDGVDSLDSVVAEGELPPDIHILRSSIGGDEGTAMLQIVHDIAPDAELYFHDRGSSQIEFVQAMDKLINAGCMIICDDITYVEPFFEDGYIARNIRDRILSYGILYVTSAGNFAQEHYQAPFKGYMDRGYAWQDFQAANGSKDLKFTAPPRSAGHIILQWDDKFSESSNNYDLFLYNSEMREIGRSVKIQDGDDDPMEYCRFINDEDRARNFYLRVVQAGGENRTIEIYVLPMGGNPVTIDPCVPEDSMFGQQSVSEALSVGAVVPETPLQEIEPYSSRGPVSIKYPKPELRQKPELAAPDRVMVSEGSGVLASFSGTSASAPHIAGLGCLLWSADMRLSSGEIKAGLINATHNENLTWHTSTGYGVPDARLLLPLVPEKSCTTQESVIPVTYSRTFKPRETEPTDNLILYPGWNMISIPFPLESGSNTGMILSGVHTASHTIWRYSASGRHWTAVQADDIFTQMDVIWVFSADRTNLSLHYDDSRQNMTARHLESGWNPLGIPGRNTITACDLLTPLGKDWSYILVYDSRIQQYRPAIINGGTGAYSDERLLYPTEGFWIYMNGPGILIP